MSSDPLKIEACGYAHPAYAESLQEFGRPRLLERSGGWLLERPISNTSLRDATGCYPFFACRAWTGLSADLDELQGTLVSAAVVPIPFGDYSVDLLQDCFPDVCRPYKEHAVVDLSEKMEAHVSAHHRRNARRAFRSLTIEVCEHPQRWIDEWVALYSQLIGRHGIEGISSFSRDSFTRQLEVPGLVMLRAEHGVRTVGIILWYEQDSVAYYHLSAYSDEGYRLRASFGLFWRSIEHFRDRARWLNLGANAGMSDDLDDGLARFKKGWATGTTTAYFCGRVLDRAAYEDLRGGGAAGEADFFPAYRTSPSDV